jgi:hypothetical protein
MPFIALPGVISSRRLIRDSGDSVKGFEFIGNSRGSQLLPRMDETAASN